MASAVWGAVLHGSGGSGPDLHGYHVDGNPCSGEALDPLKKATGARDFTAFNGTVSKGPAMDKLSCFLASSPPARQGWATTYSISVSVELHKKTDPRAEFEDTRHAQVSTLPGYNTSGSFSVAVTDNGYTSAADVHPVTGIGDAGYLLTPHSSQEQTLEVLHGGAVLTLQVSGSTQWNSLDGSDTGPGEEPADPDLGHLRPAMITAMHHLMTSLSS
ncbi:hypothetical protein [Streptomyces sp. CA-111067]|uniref:hypothetical protein n=1 Tax=Streptomyces sp. CA-111067 TaxID=3240046 RepID=UPI003D982533